jgi:type II secretory pathway pseudopilin PulG
MVIVIIGVLSGVAIPKYFNMAAEARLAADDATYGALRSAATIAFMQHRVQGLTSSGGGDDRWINSATTLVQYLDGGLPDTASVNSNRVDLQDGRRVTISGNESVDQAAQLTKNW